MMSTGKKGNCNNALQRLSFPNYFLQSLFRTKTSAKTPNKHTNTTLCQQPQNSAVTSQLKNSGQMTASDQTVEVQNPTSVQQTLPPVSPPQYVPPMPTGRLGEQARH